MIRKELEQLSIQIDEVHTHPSNVRQGDVGAISESLKAHGQYRPIVYQKSTGRILAGNHTWKAAKALGWTHIAATPVICDDQQALRILLADNKANDLATYDEPELIELLKQLADTDEGLLGTLFDEDELDTLIADQSHFELPSDVDDVPDNVPVVSKLGDVWLLGEHKVMCGDSTKISDMNKLLSGNEYQSVVTDPPYGMSFVSNYRKQKHKEIANDENIDALVWACNLEAEHSKYIFCRWDNLIEVPQPVSVVTWVKNNWSMGDLEHSHARQTETILFYNGNSHKFPNGRPTDVVNHARTGNKLHPTQKPVELIVEVIGWTEGNIFDPFGGSGSTLIAAQQTNRIAYLMELEPSYVDVICARYQKHTGNQPILEATGKAHDFTPDAD
jgi:site-specific DNA-methyltransferase (adenine-specific)